MMVQFWHHTNHVYTPMPITQVAELFRCTPGQIHAAMHAWKHAGAPAEYHHPLEGEGPPNFLEIRYFKDGQLDGWIQRVRTWGTGHRSQSPQRRFTMEVVLQI